MTNVHLVASTRNGHAPETHDHAYAPGTGYPSRADWAHEQGALLHAELEQRVERETAALRAEWRRDRLLAEDSSALCYWHWSYRHCRDWAWRSPPRFDNRRRLSGAASLTSSS